MIKLDLSGTTPSREVRAGLTTFATMAYIVAVNPLILADAGMPREAVVAATCLAAACGSILMGLLTNYPFAMAPGMGLNAFFAYTVVLGMGLSWQGALAAGPPLFNALPGEAPEDPGSAEPSEDDEVDAPLAGPEGGSAPADDGETGSMEAAPADGGETGSMEA